MLENIIAMLKIPPTITVSVCYYVYKLAEQSTSGLGRFLECQKCAWYTYVYAKCSTALQAFEHCVYISGKHQCACVITYT